MHSDLRGQPDSDFGSLGIAWLHVESGIVAFDAGKSFRYKKGAPEDALQ